MNHIGIDIGTTSICCVVNSDDNIYSITRKNDAREHPAHEWEDMQNAEKIYDIVLRLLEDVEKQYGIDSISITGQMHGILYINSQGNAVSPLFTWQDGRGNLPFKDGMTYAEHLSATTGYKLSTGYGIVTHYYNFCTGTVPKDAAKLCTIMDYVAMRLTGNTSPTTDATDAASLGCFDLKAMRFDTSAILRAGIDVSLLPKVVGWKHVVGTYKGHPVFVPIGDNQAGFIGTIGDKEHNVHLSVGTSSQISVFSPTYITVPGLDTRPCPHGGYILVGACLCGGSAYAMLHYLFADIIKRFCGTDVDSDKLYELMSSIPYKPQQAGDIVVNTLFEGTRANPSLRGSISNISINNLTAEALILGFFRGIAEELAAFYQALPEGVKGNMHYLVGTGNAIRRNDALKKALEEKFRLPMHVAPHIEGAAYGASVYGMENFKKLH